MKTIVLTDFTIEFQQILNVICLNSSRILKKDYFPTHSNARLDNNFSDIQPKALSIKGKKW